jgi:NAD-dependent oxidoreductase involved in siderophore biosynthesis
VSETAHLDIGKEHKNKLREIAEKQERSMTGQVRYWVNKHYPDKNIE